MGKYSPDKGKVYEPLVPVSGVMWRTWNAPSLGPKNAHVAFLRTLEFFEGKFPSDVKHLLLDFCCGSGTVLFTNAIMERARLEHVFGTDAQGKEVVTTQRNMLLTNIEGLNGRHGDIGTVKNTQFLQPLRDLLMQKNCQEPLPHTIFQHNAMAPFPPEIIADDSLTMVIGEMPFGMQAKLIDPEGKRVPEEELGIALLKILGNVRAKMRDHATLGLILDDANLEGDQDLLQQSEHFTYAQNSQVSRSKSKVNPIRRFLHLLEPKK